MTCISSDKNNIRIQKVSADSYKISTPNSKDLKKVPSPKMKDVWDKNKKQLFDTYFFELDGQKMIVRRPETPGPQKQVTATWMNKEFSCNKK